MASEPIFVPYKHLMDSSAAHALNMAVRAEDDVAYWTREIRTCRSLDDRIWVNRHIRAAERVRDEQYARAERLDALYPGDRRRTQP